MSRTAIIQIIILMSAALLGIVGMQVYFIFSTLRLNYELFDNNVHAALDHTVSKLEQAEIAQTATMYNLPKPTLTNDENSVVPIAITVDEISIYLNEDSLRMSATDTLDVGHFPKLEERYMAKETRKTWKKGSKEAFWTHFERYFVHHGIVQDIPIEKRISLKLLSDILKQELAQKGIETAYVYGVYSEPRDSFVKKEGYLTTVEAIYNKKTAYQYDARLFPSSNKLLATLYVDFPDRGMYVWASITLYLLGTIILSSIIIFCFYYTIRIIFNQKKVSEMKNDFLNNMTHEFKTPIATISLASDTMKSLLAAQKFDKVERFINIIKEENKRMHHQVEKVLQMARMEKRDLKLNIQEIDAEIIIQKAAANMLLQVEKRQGTIELDLQASQHHIEADETHFTNVVLNLLDNANKYSPDKPDITLRTRDTKAGLEITIKDKGLGISKEAVKQIFEPFYRVTTGNLHDVKGFGLGLSYVKGIVEAHGGSVEVQSELGKGSTFVVVFPHKAILKNNL